MSNELLNKLDEQCIPFKYKDEIEYIVKKNNDKYMMAIDAFNLGVLCALKKEDSNT